MGGRGPRGETSCPTNCTSNPNTARDRAAKSLLILDEAHVAAPAGASRYAVDSKITDVVRDIAPRFENRLFFVDKLTSMGARIVLCDPHRAIVSGPSRLHGERMESPDIRAGMAMLIASLCAEGVSEIGNVGQIDRGYEAIDERLRALGAAIERADL